MNNAEIVTEIIRDLEAEKTRLKQTKNSFELFTRDKDIQELNNQVSWLLRYRSRK